MKNIRRFAIASVALALCLPAIAQNSETANSTTTARRLSPAPAPAYTTHTSGSAKAVLVPFGPYITQTGVGVNQSNVSELYTTFTLGAVGYNIYGYGMQGTAANVLADDFTVPAGDQTWTVSSLKWLTYQTGAPTSGTITGMTLNLWNTMPTVVGGQTWSGGNVWVGNAFTGVYRVLDSGLLASGRAIIEATCSAGWVPALAAGTYWLDATATGSLASGPWGPPKVKAGQVPPTGDPWNGMQAVGGGAFVQVFDTGNPLGSINEPSDFLFQVEGTGGGGGVGKFCTSKPSSIPGCVPSLSGSSATHSKGGGAGSYTVTASPVPGGNGKPGILIYTKAGLLGTPANTPFGFLCLSGFLRAGNFPQQCGGTNGTCSGTYNWDLGAMAPSLNYAAGDTLHIQAWYRDPTNPGTANFTEGIGPISVVP